MNSLLVRRIRLDLDPALPLVVQQWESLIAVNYPARKFVSLCFASASRSALYRFGISRFDKIADAKRKCPEVVAVHVATYAEGEHRRIITSSLAESRKNRVWTRHALLSYPR
jgi:nucleotidyltransferase/DNA polymerase involved in DNA repair